LHTQVSPCYAPLVASERLSETELRAWQALMHAHDRVTETLDAELRAAHGLTLAAYDVLLRLARAPDRTLRMTDLAARVLISPSGLTRRLDRLVAQGLVGRETDPEDGRGALARLTDEGLARLRAAARTHLRGIREHFTGRLTEGQLRNVSAALESVAGPHTPH
jgi:DNA-binding MarR family transcriptional regulator